MFGAEGGVGVRVNQTSEAGEPKWWGEDAVTLHTWVCHVIHFCDTNIDKSSFNIYLSNHK